MPSAAAWACSSSRRTPWMLMRSTPSVTVVSSAPGSRPAPRSACSASAESFPPLQASARRTALRRGGLVRAAELGQVLDALARLPLRVVVLHRVDQLAHEARGQVHP